MGGGEVSGRDVLEKWIRLGAELTAWTAANPKLAADWDAAFAEDEHRAAVRCLEADERHLLATCAGPLRRMGVPEVAVETVAQGAVHGLKQTPAMLAAAAFVRGTRSALLLFGDTGAGKSVAAAWCLLRARCVENGHLRLDPTRGLFVRASEAARIPKFGEESFRWPVLLKVPWLVLDDFGRQGDSEFWGERFDELMDARLSGRLRTILTTNKADEELRAALGARVESRLAAGGMVAGAGKVDLRRAQ
jgi:hypothetical protein